MQAAYPLASHVFGVTPVEQDTDALAGLAPRVFGVSLALVVHFLLLAVFFFAGSIAPPSTNVNWNVELVSALPSTTATTLDPVTTEGALASPSPPPPAPPPPPAATAAPSVAKAAPPPPTSGDINIGKKPAPPDRNNTARDKAAADKAQADKEVATKQSQEQATAELEKLRAQRSQLLRAQAAASGAVTRISPPANQPTPAATRPPPSGGDNSEANYLLQISRLLREQVYFDTNPYRQSNPRAAFSLELDKDGRITKIRLDRESSVSTFDEAIEAGLRRMGKLPPRQDGSLPPRLVIEYQMFPGE